MATFEQLVNAAQEKGFPFEAFSTKFDRWGNEISEETIFQVSIRDYMWLTFSGMEMNGETEMSFEQRYSQRTGRSSKSWKIGNNALVDLGLRESKF